MECNFCDKHKVFKINGECSACEAEKESRKQVVASSSGYVLIPKELLSELKENTIECYNNSYAEKVNSWDSDRAILRKYQEQMKQIDKLLSI
jgi:hypothetical protein